MRLATILSTILLFVSTNLFAQTNLSIGLHSGVLFSAFEDQDETLTAIPLGGYFGIQISDNIEIGVEYNTTVSGFANKVENFQFFDETFGLLDLGDFTQEITQSVLGGYARLYFPMESIVPYLRAGVAYYSGSSDETYSDFSLLDDEYDFEGSVGFNIGAGFGTESGLYAEFIYHIVSQKYEVGGDSFGLGNFGGHIGYSFSIN